jgi:DNA-binding response OmpR family regulator
MKLLLVNDSAAARGTLAAELRRGGHVVELAADGESGRWAALSLDADAVVIDLHAPPSAGLALLRDLRARGCAVPALLMAATADVEERLLAFEGGADDCLARPADPRELAARARALVSRARALPCGAVAFGDLRLDPARAQVCRDGRPVPMRRRERLLLELLFEQQGRVVSRAKIEAKLYADCTELQSNCVEAAVSQLRRWIDPPLGPSRITTLRGEGYRLDC